MAKSLIPRVLREHEERSRALRGWNAPIGARFLYRDPDTQVMSRWEIVEKSKPTRYSGHEWPSKLREVVSGDAVGRETVFSDARGFELWLNYVIGDGEAWERGRWQRFAPVGSLFLKRIRNPTPPKDDEAVVEQYEAFVKFQPGTEPEDWALMGRELPILDEETLAALSPDELLAIRNTEDRCAVQRMANVDAIDTEIKRRDETFMADLSKRTS